jgi:hypothetical protein
MFASAHPDDYDLLLETDPVDPRKYFHRSVWGLAKYLLQKFSWATYNVFQAKKSCTCLGTFQLEVSSKSDLI